LALIIVEKDEIPIVQCRTPLASWFWTSFLPHFQVIIGHASGWN
jgi:hypothetical protein